MTSDNPFGGVGLGKTYIDGSSGVLDRGYHDLPFAEYNGAPTHRKGTQQRVDAMVAAYPGDIVGQRGLDVGCSVGGISFGLQLAGAQMHGFDYDPAAIAVARRVEDEQQTGATFEEMSLPGPDWIDAIEEGSFDFVVWLSNFMWVAKQVGYDNAEAEIERVAEHVPVLIFDTAQHANDGGAGRYQPFNGAQDVEAMLNNHYSNVQNLGVVDRGWNDRSLFVCS